MSYSNVIVFVFHPIKGQVFFGQFPDHKTALAAIAEAPNQDWDYSIYWNTDMPATLFPHTRIGRCSVFEFKRAVSGKKSVRSTYIRNHYCIKANGMPFMFCDTLFEDDNCPHDDKACSCQN